VGWFNLQEPYPRWHSASQTRVNALLH
jgi:hypothetical protein